MTRIVAAASCAALLAAACAIVPPREKAPADGLAARVHAALARAGLGSDALLITDNVLRHEPAAPPPGAPPIVRELLGDPLAAADAATLFYRSLPGALRRLVEQASTKPASPAPAASIPIRQLLDPYLADLAEAQRMLRSAARGTAVDADAMLAGMTDNFPPAPRIAQLAADFDRPLLDRAVTRFIEANGRLIAALRAARGRIGFPDRPVRFDSPVGVVSIGTSGDDVHAADAAVIVDPGGNDVYERAPVTGGSVSVIVDLAGDDRYRGSDVVLHGLSAIIDFAGNDRYSVDGAGLGAAVAGASLLLDFSGDDVYEAGLFAEGAAALGLGALVDLAGKDQYRVRSGGQGFGLTGGVGLLWDRSGDDTYTAAGLRDAFERGGGLSWAQGAALGLRTALGGGIGILRDDAGDDRYEAQMFAQGTAYYYGLGLLWDQRGDDRYRAVRYAQGNGVHQAVGVLRDDAGGDRYDMTIGVGQGMGLDLAVGVLVDAAGDDVYRAPAHAQGDATANGVGIAFDAGGADRWHASANPRVWGRGEPLRGLPSVGVILYDVKRSVFARDDKSVPAPESSVMEPFEEPPASTRGGCPRAAPAADGAAQPLAEILRAMTPGFAAGSPDPGDFAQVQRRLTRGLRASMAELPAGDFDVLFSFGEALRCTLAAASPEDARAMWNDLERALDENPRTPFVGAIAGALRVRAAPVAQMQRMLAVLDAHPGCGVRAGALLLREAVAADTTSRGALVSAAQRALRDPCWRLEAQALGVLGRLSVPIAGRSGLPSFLRRDPPAP